MRSSQGRNFKVVLLPITKSTFIIQIQKSKDLAVISFGLKNENAFLSIDKVRLKDLKERGTKKNFNLMRNINLTMLEDIN